MGKNRNKRFGSLRQNPIGFACEGAINLDVDLSEEHDAGKTPSAIINILEKLQAPSSEERACGCQIMASIVSQPTAIPHLLKEKSVKIAAPLFVDPCLDVRKCALGAMRNMCVYGDEKVCDAMISQDIMTPLTALVKQYCNDWAPSKEAKKGDTSADVLVEALELLAILSENNATAVRWFNKEGLLSIVLPLFNVETLGFPIVIAAARCLHVVSENNPEISPVLCQSEMVGTLAGIIRSSAEGIDGVLFRTLVSGILLNLSGVETTSYIADIISASAEVLEMDLVSALKTALDSVVDTDEEMSFEPEMTWPFVDKLLDAQGVALELLANLCCSDDEWEDMEGRESESSSDDPTAGATVEEMDVADIPSSSCPPSELNSVFVERNLLSKILSKTAPLDPPLVTRLEATQCGKSALSKIYRLWQRALLCLSNMIGVLEESSISQSVSLSSLWSELYKMTQIEKVATDEDLLWSVTSALRAVIQRSLDFQIPQLSELCDSDLNCLVQLGAQSKNRETQINIVRILSTFGCIGAPCQGSWPSVKKIGSILLEVACKNEDLVVVSEALDSLFDIFKEDNTDSIVREIQLVEKLTHLQPSFKTKVSSQKRTLSGENYGVVMMAKSNLAGFIKYKTSRK